MATSIDDNAADEKSDKSIWRLLNIHCTFDPSILMMPGSKGQKAVHACMIRPLNADREATAFMSK